MNKENLKTFLEVRNLLQGEESLLKEKRLEFDNSVDPLKKRIEELKLSLNSLKEEIEKDAIEEFKETKQKKLLGGIGIREKKHLIYDEKTAFNWAKEKGTCLLLDKKKFEKIALELTDFVVENKEIQVTFPKEVIF
jgi:hypothetical protein